MSTLSEVNEKVLPAITLHRKEDQDLDPAVIAECSQSDLPCPVGGGGAFHQRRQFSRQRGSISLDESILVTPRSNAPTIHLIPDAMLSVAPSSDDDTHYLVGAEPVAGNTTSNGEQHDDVLFYACESNGGQPRAARPDCRNSLPPRVSLTSLGRAFTPRSSWNGSKAALLQLQRKPGRLEGVPAYLAKKCHISAINSNKEQVLWPLTSIKMISTLCE